MGEIARFDSDIMSACLKGWSFQGVDEEQLGKLTKLKISGMYTLVNRGVSGPGLKEALSHVPNLVELVILSNFKQLGPNDGGFDHFWRLLCDGVAYLPRAKSISIHLSHPKEANLPDIASALSLLVTAVIKSGAALESLELSLPFLASGDSTSANLSSLTALKQLNLFGPLDLVLPSSLESLLLRNVSGWNDFNSLVQALPASLTKLDLPFLRLSGNRPDTPVKFGPSVLKSFSSRGIRCDADAWRGLFSFLQSNASASLETLDMVLHDSDPFVQLFADFAPILDALSSLQNLSCLVLTLESEASFELEDVPSEVQVAELLKRLCNMASEGSHTLFVGNHSIVALETILQNMNRIHPFKSICLHKKYEFVEGGGEGGREDDEEEEEDGEEEEGLNEPLRKRQKTSSLTDQIWENASGFGQSGKYKVRVVNLGE